MLSRARGLLPARVGHGRPTTGKRCIPVSTRTYVDVSGRPDSKARYGNNDGEKSAPSQSATAESPLVRRVPLEKSRAKESFDTQTRPASKRRTEQTENKWGTRKATNASGVKRIDMRGRLAFGVVTTSRPTDTSLDELVKDIEPLPKVTILGHHENPTLLVMLLTPGLARYALDSKLSEALYKRFKIRIKPGVQIETTSAIVDRLPAGVDEPEGSEGMAYMLFRDPPKAKLEDRTVFQQSAQKPGSLTFRMPRWTEKRNSPLKDFELQLPLSQTVFTTGLVSTLIHRTFGWKGQPNSPALALFHEQKLESQTLQLPAMRGHKGTSLTLPLVPLTPFRKIEYVMGNIIRKLSSQPTGAIASTKSGQIDQAEGSEVTDASMPASEELEKSVSRYFEALDLQPETVSVWAFVVPRILREGAISRQSFDHLLSADEKSITSAWHSDTAAAVLMAKHTNVAIRQMIPEGARLIKVLSGGGGWGKKAGLLSLDPDVQYSTRDLRQDQGWKFDFDGVDDGTGASAEAQKNQALGQIVKKDEMIMFLLAPKPEHVPEQPAREDDVTLHREKDDLRTKLYHTFGPIPSSIDMIPQEVASDTNVATIRHYPGRFGMLSEGGMAVTINGMDGPRGQSKLDVPGSRYDFRHSDRYYFPLASAAQWREQSAAGSVASQASAAQQTPGTEQADLFQSFAEHDETKDANPTLADLENENLDSLLTPR
jgi:hypothetical protein